MRRIGWYLLLLGLVYGVACAGEDEPQNKDPGKPKAQVIGADGGVVTFEGLSISVPAGALSEDVEITVAKAQIEPTGDFTRLSAVYEFGPDGLQFLLPVAVSIPFVGAASDPGIYWASSGAPFERIGGSVEGGAVVAEVMHFSQGFVGEEKEPDEEEPGDEEPDDEEPGDGSDLEVTSLQTWPREGASSYSITKVAAASDGDVFTFGAAAGPLQFGTTPFEGSGPLLVRFGPDGEARWTHSGLPALTDLVAPLPAGGLLYAARKEVTALDADGQESWRLKVTGGELWARSAAVDERGNIAVVGVANGGPNLGGGPLTSTGGQPALFAILDSAGKHVSSTSHFGADGFASHLLVAAAPGGGFFVAGEYMGQGPDLGGGPLPSTGAVSGSQFVHLARFDASGAHVWSVGFGTEGDQSKSLMPTTMAVAGDKISLTVRYLDGKHELATGPISDERGGGLAILQVNAANGTLEAHKAFHGPTMDRNPIVPDDGSIYLTGGIENETVNFGGGVIPPDDDEANPAQNGYLAVVGHDGSHQLSHGWGGSRNNETFEIHLLEGHFLVPDGKGGYWFLGQYMGDMKFTTDEPLPKGDGRQFVLVHFDEAP